MGKNQDFRTNKFRRLGECRATESGTGTLILRRTPVELGLIRVLRRTTVAGVGTGVESAVALSGVAVNSRATNVENVKVPFKTGVPYVVQTVRR